MEVYDHLMLGLSTISTVPLLLAILAGVLYGIVAGAMPGLSPSTAVAILVPFSYAMDPVMAIVLLTSVYIASNYGGSISAILINTPGTPAAAVTVLDGFELTRQGRAGEGLGVALFASTIGGVIGVLVLIGFSTPLSAWAIKFSPADYFALAIFGVATVASMGQGHVLKALIAIVFGLLIKSVGVDPISGATRFTFGFDQLYDGFNLIPILIGLFAVSVVFEYFSGVQTNKESAIPTVSTKLPAWDQFKKIRRSILQSSLFGTIIGIFPGAGATIASFISYDFAKRQSQNPEEFGAGSLEGVAASEAANSSSVGGALIPLLSLGIPGSATDAVLIGAFMLHDLSPGPLLFTESPNLVYGIFASLLVANVLILAIGYFGNRLFLKIVSIPQAILNPLILSVAMIGSFSVNSSIFDVGTCIGFGVIGWFMRRHKYPVAPVVLGVVLGKMIEENFRRAVIMDGYSAFITNPLSLILLTLAIASFVVPFFKKAKVSQSAP
jgi:putative tricarboxylic transport membrane protein